MYAICAFRMDDYICKIVNAIMSHIGWLCKHYEETHDVISFYNLIHNLLLDDYNSLSFPGPKLYSKIKTTSLWTEMDVYHYVWDTIEACASNLCW